MVIPCHACGAKNRVPVGRLHQRSHCGRCKAPTSPVGKPIALGSTAEFDELTGASSLPVLVDFWAAWCGPCRAVAPELERLAESHAGKLVIAKVDTEALREVAARHAIRSIPTLMLFRDGRMEKQVAGAMSAAQIAQAFQL